MKMLGNSSRGLSPTYKCLLYRTYILPIVLYGFQLLVLQKSSTLLSSQRVEENAKKSNVIVTIDAFWNQHGHG